VSPNYNHKLTDRYNVIVIDDESGRLRPCVSALATMGLRSVPVASPLDFLLTPHFTAPSCVLASLRLSGLSVPRFMAGIRTKGGQHPVVFVADPSELSVGVEATRAGAFEIIKTPIVMPEFESAIRRALAHIRSKDVEADEQGRRTHRLGLLTHREREILPLLIAGRTSKEIGRRLGISHRTAERHRENILDKFETRTVVELVAKHFGTG